MSNTGPQVTNIDNRPWFKKPIGIAGIVGGIVLVGAIGSAGGGDDPKKAADTSTPAASSSTQAAPKETSSSSKKATPAPKPTWKKVAALQGNTNKSGPDFHLNGCDARLIYDVKGGDMSLVAFYVMESGKKLLEDGGIPVASPSESGRGETVLREDEGDYYIEVMGANANWTAEVQEKC